MCVFTGFICLQCHFLPIENKYSCGNEVKQEEEIVDQAAGRGEEEEKEGGVHLLAVCQEGMLSVAFEVFYRFAPVGPPPPPRPHPSSRPTLSPLPLTPSSPQSLNAYP